MSGETWSVLRGNTSEFALRLTFEENPDPNDKSLLEEAASWGAVQIWVRGQNLCAHYEFSEVMESVHWYLLPLLEWFVDNWNPLFHEERLPSPSYSTAVDAESARPVIVHDANDEMADTWWSWWTRHALWASRAGGPFPNVFLRRWRDEVELSWNSRRPAGIPEEVTFLSPSGFARVPTENVARPTFGVIHSAVAELRQRLPDSERIQNLAARTAALLATPEEEVYRDRFAWLSGFTGATERFRSVWERAEEQLRAVRADIKARLTGRVDGQDVVIPGTPYAAVLFGSLSPTVVDQDVLSLTRLLVENATTEAERIDRVGSGWNVQVDDDLPPWDQGNDLAEQTLEVLELDQTEYIDVERILRNLGVRVDELPLSDRGIRSVALAGPYQRTTIVINAEFRNGTSDAVIRFSLAHEFCHLLIDQDRASRLVVASGPWAPLDIEQRANAFAAAFLLPEAAVEAVLRERGLPLDRLETISAIARKYGVSHLTAIDRIYNLGYMDRDVRDELRAKATISFREKSELSLG